MFMSSANVQLFRHRESTSRPCCCHVRSRPARKFSASFWCEFSGPRRAFFELAFFLFLTLALARGEREFP